MVGIKFISRDDLTRFWVKMSFLEIDELFIRLVSRFGWGKKIFDEAVRRGAAYGQ